MILAHAPLLRVPFYWDEAGQFIPAALDLFRAHAWIPVSTMPNVHPPGIMAYLAACWSAFGFSIETTRLAMLLFASLGALFTLLLAIELGREAPGTPAFIALALLLISPLFFAQSMLAQLDMPAMCVSILALLLFLQDRIRWCVAVCAVLVMVKETGVIVPALFAGWMIAERRYRESLWFALPLSGLAAWLFALHHATGDWFGNRAFASYNLAPAIHPLRVVTAFLRRIYQLFAGTGFIIGTVALLWALPRMPLFRTRAWRISATFVGAHIVFFSFFGGAVLERYLLPAMPVVLIAFSIALCGLMRRTRIRTAIALIACLGLANFINPPYPFPFEDNLAFVNFVDLEASAARAVESTPAAAVAAAFPVSDALRRPCLGFVSAPRQVTEIRDFSAGEIAKLKDSPPALLIVSSEVWDPYHILDRQMVQILMKAYLGYTPQLSASRIAGELGMRATRQWRRGGMTIELLERL